MFAAAASHGRVAGAPTQTPPSGAPTQTAPAAAPTSEAKLRSDADIQREIDARVEAAKKELREEMRAQAATVAATSAGSSWETEAATHRKLDQPGLERVVGRELLQGLVQGQQPRGGPEGRAVSAVGWRFRGC